MLLEFLLHGSRYNKQKPIVQGKLFHREQNRIVQRGEKKNLKQAKQPPQKTINFFLMSRPIIFSLCQFTCVIFLEN